MKPPPETCPNCGADVPRNARACPACGADEHTGWSDEAHANGLDLPSQEFDYDDFIQREFEPERQAIPRGMKPLWWIVAIGLLLLLLGLWLGPRF